VTAVWWVWISAVGSLCEKVASFEAGEKRQKDEDK